MPQSTLWRLVESSGKRTTSPQGPDFDVLTLTLECEGRAFVVTVAGPSGMSNIDVVNACRATAGTLIKASGGDPSTVTGAPEASNEAQGTVQ